MRAIPLPCKITSPGLPPRIPCRPRRPGLGPDAAALPAPGQAAVDARGYAKQALAPATRRAYRADLAHFSDWCRAQRWKALPAAPEAVAAYLATLATTHTRSTIRRRLVAIGQAHLPVSRWDLVTRLVAPVCCAK